MYAKEHLVVSLVVGGTVAATTTGAVARLKQGDWGALRSVVSNLRETVLHRETAFDTGEVPPHERLFSHAVVGGVAVGALALARPLLAATAALALYFHVLGDLYADVFRDEGYFDDVCSND